MKEVKIVYRCNICTYDSDDLGIGNFRSYDFDHSYPKLLIYPDLDKSEELHICTDCIELIANTSYTINAE